jgi:apolipoprotein N-acyltransferase
MSPRLIQVPAVLRWSGAVLTGVALDFSFPGWNQSWLAWIALAPLLAAIWLPAPEPRDPARSKWTRWLFQPGPFLLGYTAGATFFLLTFHWLIEVTGLGWVMLCLYLAIFPAAWSWLMARTFGPASIQSFLSSAFNLQLALVGAASWTGLEWLRGIVFSWNGLGVALHSNLPLLQLSAFGGVGGLSFLLAFVNIVAVATVIRFSLEIRAGRLRPHFDFTITMAMVVSLFAFGFYSLRSAQPALTRTPLHFAAVQPAIPQNEKFDPATASRVLSKLERFTDIAIATQPQLLLWPEAATTSGLFYNEADYKFVTALAQRGSFYFLLGTLDFEFADNGRRSDYNAAVMLPPNGGDAQIYRKIFLVPFGEFIPLRNSFPVFVWIVGAQVPGDFTSGGEPGVFEMANPQLKVAPLVCFEDTLGYLTREPVRRGAQLFINITNDGWFNRSIGSRQHLANAVFSAAENHRPLLRCANTGVTCAVDEFGRIRQILADESGDTFAPGVLSGVIEVPTNAPLTFYTRFGEAFTIVCLLFATLHALITVLARRVKKSAA